jgi:UDP-glucose 4-epimerase
MMDAQPEQSILADRRILITGASGFLGKHLCRRLSECKADLHGVSRSPCPKLERRVRWWQGDMADLETVRALVTGLRPDAIVHLSGQVDALPDRDLVLPTLNSLLVSTVNILTAAAESGQCSVVLTGSLREPEEAEAAPDSPYSAAKWASSAYGRMFQCLYDLPVVILRPFMTYGPGQNPVKLIPNVTLALLRGERPQLSGGHWLADWIYVDDVIDAIVAALETPSAAGCTFDLGTGQLVSVRAIVQQLIDLTDSDIEPCFGTLPERPIERIRIAAAEHTYDRLGWRARTTLPDGLRRTVDWYSRRLREHAI